MWAPWGALMRIAPKLLVILAAAAATPAPAHAGFIIQDQFDITIQVNAFEPIGQSFTAEDPGVKFAFFYTPINGGALNDPLEIRLLAGDGLGGPQLGSFTFSMPSGFSGFFDVDFSSVTLTVGQQYTAVVIQPGSSPYWGVELQQNTNPYSGGRAYFTSGFGLQNNPGDDFRFRVTPVAVAAVPAPPALVLAGLGIAGLLVRRRQRAVAA